MPNNTQIAAVLVDASSTVSGFDIEGESITVNGIGKCSIRFEDVCESVRVHVSVWF